MPGRFVDHDHHPRVGRGRIGPGHLPQMRRKARLEMAVFGEPWLLALTRPLDHTRRQSPIDEIQGAKDIDILMTIEITDQGPVAFDTQGGAQRGDQGKARLILAQQDKLSRLRCFFKAARSCRAAACCTGSPLR
jgi:hypothetical protein